MGQSDRLRCRRDLDAVAGERKPDPIARHAIDTVALVEIGGEEAHPVLDPPLGEVAGHHRGGRLLEDAEAAADGVEDDPLHPLRRHLVRRDDVDRAPRPGLGLGEIADRRLGQLSVGDDDVRLVERQHLRGPPVDFDHLADVGLIGVVLDPVPDLEGMLGVDRQPREDIAEGVLEGEPEDRGEQRRSGQQPGGIDPGVPQHRQEGGRQHQEAEDVEKDPRQGPGDPLPDRHREDEEDRLEERRDEEEAEHMVRMPHPLLHSVGGHPLGGKDDRRREGEDRQPEERDRLPGELSSPLRRGEEVDGQGDQRQDPLTSRRAIRPTGQIEEELIDPARRHRDCEHRQTPD